MPATLPDAPPAHHAAVSSALDHKYLAPEDAYFNSTASAAAMSARKRKERARSASRRRKGDYKKLLWFRQPCEYGSMRRRVGADF
jgi:phosphatidylinositol glycan class C protein